MWAADHPRSRGVYMTVSPTRSTHGGSSPLARGLRVAVDDQGPRAGSSPLARGLPAARPCRWWGPRIIPARAGFTKSSMVSVSQFGDHPRSRGVYEAIIEHIIDDAGSSPLARGLLPVGADGDRRGRIIPARAGFTGDDEDVLPGPEDHPRSRGVYVQESRPSVSHAGSSPLARGLHNDLKNIARRRRIIPARAGFTLFVIVMHRWGKDHPRSRGVYSPSPSPSCGAAGSSPLARGLPDDGDPQQNVDRIIPARAGFTRCPTASHSPFQDHPRSRGVYY